MHRGPTLYWLPDNADWRRGLTALAGSASPTIEAAIALASARLDFVKTNALASVVHRQWPAKAPESLNKSIIRLAILSSSTVDHLVAPIRIAGLRFGLWIEFYVADYGQYLQELLDPASALHTFAPTAVLFAFDAAHMTIGLNAVAREEDAVALFSSATVKVKQCWTLAREAFGCPVLQQTILPAELDLLGGNEHRLPGSRAALIGKFNAWLRENADGHVDLVAIDARAARDGLDAWYDPRLWHRSKQEVVPTAAPFYGEMVVRLLAAQKGRSRKCLVLDLDNTLWGGVIGDDGLDGIVIGQGSPLGEAFVAVQTYARDLARRGVILAVVSKNDEANALEAFEKHPDMVLRRDDISCFIANWDDKASNIRKVAQALNIGLDSLVFLDDNPFERELVRRELPMVAVPEIDDDSTYYPRTLADAGYFESLGLTDEDRERTSLYRANRMRDEAQSSSTDLASYLRSLEMTMVVQRFDMVGLQRTHQLINKTNQFNLTTRRYSKEDVEAVVHNPEAVGLQLRLLDRFGDNGIIAVLIGRKKDADLYIDTWLMSCRVLGRKVESAALNVLAEAAQRLGAHALIGEFRPTAKNGMVRNHYQNLGFESFEQDAEGNVFSRLQLGSFSPVETPITIQES